MLRITRRDLASAAGVSSETVRRIERATGPISAMATTVERITQAIESRGVRFTDGDRPGVTFTKG
jgi:hypothetical protein